MAVAVKNAMEATTQGPVERLQLASLLGAVYLLGSIGVVFYGITALWWHVFFRPEQYADFKVPFMVVGLLVLTMLVVGAGLVALGIRLVGPNPPHGFRAGVGVGAAGILVIVFLTWCLGLVLETWLGPGHQLPGGEFLGVGITLAVGIGLLTWAGRTFLRPQFADTLIRIEDQGWFSAAGYKKSQGIRVRRGTIVGILLLAGAGIFTLHAHKTLELGSKHWLASVPFTGQQILVLGEVRFTVPVLLTIGSLWLAYRLVNFPVFADFLIATEAELNKVSWTSRRRLFQDTIVVLVTVVLLTLFLLVVDVGWSWFLSRDPFPAVIKLPDDKKAVQDEKEQPW